MGGLAVNITRRVLFENGPGILREQYYEKYQKKPDWTDRLQDKAGSHKKSETDPHKLGLALDIILFANIPHELNIANSLVEIFLNLREEMSWETLVYNHSEWNSHGQKFPKKRFLKRKDGTSTTFDDGIFGHITHVHIHWNKATINTSNFEDSLREALRSAYP